MLSQKNRLMFPLSLIVILLSITIHLLHRVFDIFQHHGVTGHMNYDLTIAERYAVPMNFLLIIPIVIFAIAYMLYRKQSSHPYIPMLNTLVLCFSSISMVAGGGGAVEYHFSIFMVLAIVSYYEEIKLMLTMTLLFAAQHLLGFFLIPELVFGTSSYSFMMLVIHAFFLIATSAATSIQIVSKNKMTSELAQINARQQAELTKMLDIVKHMAHELDTTSTTVTNKSEYHIQSNADMLTSCDEVSTGLQAQSDSVSAVHDNLMQINHMIQHTASLSQTMTIHAGATDQLIGSNMEHIQSLYEQVVSSSETIQEAAMAMMTLNKSTQQVQSIISTIQDIANRTNLLALNASIEAAHAKEYGKGFSVVASEIRQLAEQSGEATAQIQQILMNIRTQSLQSTSQMEAGQLAATQSVQQAEQSISSYTQMTQSVNQLISHLHDLNQSLTHIELRSRDISTEMTSIDAVTTKSVHSMEQLQQLSHSQLAVTHEVNKELIRLKEQSRSLQAQF